MNKDRISSSCDILFVDGNDVNVVPNCDVPLSENVAPNCNVLTSANNFGGD